MPILLILLFVVIAVPSFGQGDFRGGYIVTASGDSIAGFVDYRAAGVNFRTCFFRAERRSDTKRYYPDDLRAYGYYGDKRFESKSIGRPRVDQSSVFMQALVKGKLSIYSHGKSFFVEKDSLIELSVRNEIRTIETGRGVNKTYYSQDRRYIGLLNLLLSDCNLTANNTPFAERELVNLIKNYNRCKNVAFQEFKVSRKFTLLNYFFFSGLKRSVFSMEVDQPVSFQPSVSAVFGGGLEISSPKVFDRTYLSFEVWYAKTTHQGYGQTLSAENLERRTDYFVDISGVRMPIGIRYNFLHDARTPYVKVGFVTGIKTRSLFSLIDEQKSGGEVVVVLDSFVERKNPNGLWAAAGFNTIVYGGAKAFVEVRYEMVNRFWSFSNATGESTFNFVAGVRF